MAVVFLFIATLLIFLGIEKIIDYQRAVKEGYHTKATILNVTITYTGLKRTGTRVNVEFLDSEGLTRQASYNGLGVYYAGESVQICFHKDQVYEREGLQNVSNWLTLIAGGSLALGCLVSLYLYGV